MVFRNKETNKMKKSEKPLFIENLAEVLKAANTAILVNYSGMSVKAQQELKKRLREVDAKMSVSKNTLLKLATKKAGLDEKSLTDEVLFGQTAIVTSTEDPISPLQVIAKFTKEFEVPEMRVGFVEGSFQNNESLLKLSKLPGKDALFGQVVGAIAGPAYGLVGTLNANLQKLIHVLTQASQKAPGPEAESKGGE